MLRYYRTTWVFASAMPDILFTYEPGVFKTPRYICTAFKGRIEPLFWHDY